MFGKDTQSRETGGAGDNYAEGSAVDATSASSLPATIDRSNVQQALSGSAPTSLAGSTTTSSSTRDIIVSTGDLNQRVVENTYKNLLIDKHSILLSKDFDDGELILNLNNGFYESEIIISDLTIEEMRFVNNSLKELVLTDKPQSAIDNLLLNFDDFRVKVETKRIDNPILKAIDEAAKSFVFENGSKLNDSDCPFEIEEIKDNSSNYPSSEKSTVNKIFSNSKSDGYRIINKAKKSEDSNGQWDSADIIFKDDGIYLIMDENREDRKASKVEFKLADSVAPRDSEFLSVAKQDSGLSKLKNQISTVLSEFEKESLDPPQAVDGDFRNKVRKEVYAKKEASKKWYHLGGYMRVDSKYKRWWFKIAPWRDPLYKQEGKIVINESKLIRNLTKDQTFDCRSMKNVVMVSANSIFTKIKGTFEDSLFIDNSLFASSTKFKNCKGYCNHIISGIVPSNEKSDAGGFGLFIDKGDWGSSNFLTGNQIDLELTTGTRFGFKCYNAKFGKVELNYHKTYRPIKALVQSLVIKWNFRDCYIEPSELSAMGPIVGKVFKDIEDEDSDYDIAYNFNYLSDTELLESIKAFDVFSDAYESNGVLYGLMDLRSNRPYKIYKDANKMGNLIKEFTDFEQGDTTYTPIELFYEIMKTTTRSELGKFSRYSPYKLNLL